MAGGNNIRTAFPVFNGYAPKQGPKALPIALDFSAVQRIEIDLLLEETQGVIQYVQSVWVDNADNAQSLTLIFGQTGQRLVIPAGAQGTWPVIAPDQTRMVAISTGGILVNIILMNVPMASEQSGPVTINTNVTPGPLATPNVLDHSGSIAVAATSQSLMPVAATRRGIMIYNPASNAESIWVNYTIASVMSQPSIEIVPGEKFFGYPSGLYSTLAITVIALSAGIPYVAKSYNT